MFLFAEGTVFVVEQLEAAERQEHLTPRAPPIQEEGCSLAASVSPFLKLPSVGLLRKHSLWDGHPSPSPNKSAWGAGE